jgi:agmatine/peptidylarginine deiminase
MWVRDYGPHFTRRADGTTELVDTEWAPALDEPDEGMEYSPPRLIAERLGMRAQAGRVRIPGGNLINNGDGLVVTTAAVLGENLPLGLDRTQMQMRMRRLFGARNWLCLEPLDGEPTGHVDMFVTFPAADVALVGQMDPATDATNARILDDAATAIASQKTSDGKPIRVYRIPMPDGSDGIWRSYTNGIYANGVAVVPTYSDVPPEMNQKALALYQKVLPHWKVAGINADSVIELGGAVHCVTMNVPSFVKIDLAVIRALEKAAPRRVAIDGEEVPTCDGDPYEPENTDADVPETYDEEYDVPERSSVDVAPLRAA